MALFGRRQPGFSKEVELKPSEIPGEFSDALDPAVNRELDNPKTEKHEKQEAAENVISGAEKPDIFDYMQSLPEVEDPFPPSAPEPEAPPEPNGFVLRKLSRNSKLKSSGTSLALRKPQPRGVPHFFSASV